MLHNNQALSRMRRKYDGNSCDLTESARQTWFCLQGFQIVNYVYLCIVGQLFDLSVFFLVAQNFSVLKVIHRLCTV